MLGWELSIQVSLQLIYYYYFIYSYIGIGLDYWLRMVSVQAPQCPILIVGTHVDDVAYSQSKISTHMLTRKFPQIRGFYGVSCKQLTNISKLRDDLVKIAWKEPCIFNFAA